MLHKRIIVCLDIRDGRVARDVCIQDLRGVTDPARIAACYEAEGADEILFLDSSTSDGGRTALLDAVRSTAERLFIPLNVSLDVTDLDGIAAVLNAGADKISLGTAAVSRPELISEAAQRFGSPRVVASIDAKIERRRGEMSVDQAGEGVLDEQLEDLDWYRVFTQRGGTATPRNAVAWAEQCAQLGCGEILLTSIDRDGVRDGYDLELTARVVERVPVSVMASGGAGSAEHMRDAFVIAGADGAVAGGVFRDGVIRIRDVKRELDAAGVPVRLPTVQHSRAEASQPLP